MVKASGVNFVQFAESHGLIIDHLIEGRWARVKTVDKHHHRNGAYKFLGDVGFVQNHANMDAVAVWKPEGGAIIDRVAMREQARRAHADTLARQNAAAARAHAMLGEAAIERHPYLRKKGFPKETGFVREGELLIPMRGDGRKLLGVQRIKADGSKLFLSGTKAAGAMYALGSDMAKERWICEGYATALSLRAALADLRRSAQVIVAFSAGNIKAIAPHIRRPAFIMADCDLNGVGAAAAVATGLPWVMPDEDGFDCNDVHQQHGLRALVELVRSVDSTKLSR